MQRYGEEGGGGGEEEETEVEEEVAEVIQLMGTVAVG